MRRDNKDKSKDGATNNTCSSNTTKDTKEPQSPHQQQQQQQQQQQTNSNNRASINNNNKSNNSEQPQSPQPPQQLQQPQQQEQNNNNENEEKEKKYTLITKMEVCFLLSSSLFCLFINYCLLKDFPEECQKLIKQSGIPREKLDEHFVILLNVLHFRTGKVSFMYSFILVIYLHCGYIFKTPETVNDPPRPVLPRSTRLRRGGM